MGDVGAAATVARTTVADTTVVAADISIHHGTVGYSTRFGVIGKNDSL